MLLSCQYAMEESPEDWTSARVLPCKSPVFWDDEPIGSVVEAYPSSDGTHLVVVLDISEEAAVRMGILDAG